MRTTIKSHSVLLFIATIALIKSCQSIEIEEDDDKTPFDFVKNSLDKIADDPGMPAVHGYEVEESVDEDYPDDSFEGAASSHLGSYSGLLGPGLQRPISIGGINGVGGIGLGGLGLTHHLPQLGGGLLYQPGPLLGIHGGSIGGGYIDKSAYDAAEKKEGDENLEKLAAKAEQASKHGEEGFQHGLLAAKSEKGDSSFFKGEGAQKKAAGDEKYYEGVQKVDKGGLNEHSHKTAKSHKKGHVSKGFKTSSSKNEEEKTETFYDEAHDEADHRDVNANQAKYDENAASGFKGQHEEKVVDANTQGKEAHQVSEHKVDDAKGNKGGYAQHAQKSGAEELEKFNNLGAHSIHGHQESSGEFKANKPYSILPIHGFK